MGFLWTGRRDRSTDHNMTNAAILVHPEAYNTKGPALMGRHSAGESFLKGFLRHADVERFYFWNFGGGPTAAAEAMINAIEPITRPATWVGRFDFPGLEQAGALFFNAPANVQEAWNRRMGGSSRRYSITGITHTTATAQVMDAISNMLLSPVEPWDALICTSSAVRDCLSQQLENTMDYLGSRLGATRTPAIRLETIPLGLNTEEFTPKAEDRAQWRKDLGIADDAIAVLYMGRFSMHSKMNPAPMGVALARAAERTGRPVHWIVTGWSSANLEAGFKQAVTESAPGVTVHFVDGRVPTTRFSIWHAADIFFSLSDNVQETYGLTPVEAMAAGLPCVISDWDGYKDTVRHGVDGFRIPAYMPPPGGGADFAARFYNQMDSYETYIGGTSHFTAVDLDEATDALSALIDNPPLRQRMGSAARERAVRDFDWKAIIPRYQALWGELAAIRKAATTESPMPDNPWRPDPYSYFANYPTEPVRPDMRFQISAGADAAQAAARLQSPSAGFARHYLPSEAEVTMMMQVLADNGPMTAEAFAAAMPANRRPALERSLLWLAKHGFVSVLNGKKPPLEL